jgi:invasion protein IalB
MRDLLSAGLACAISTALLFAAGPAAAATLDQPHETPERGRAAWSGQRMALGLQANRWRGDPAAALPRPRRRSQCGRWRAAASRLGETYAGHLLRETVIRRECRFHEADRVEETWDWPWASLSGGRVVPPRLHADLGAWEIRCGSAGTRRRCALLHRSPILADQEMDEAEPAIVTHFVIDSVGGRESLLWRMFVPAEVSSPGPPPAGAGRSGASSKRPSHGTVRYRLSDAERTEPFPVCTRSACLMEANIHHAGDVATRLWDGQPVNLHIRLRSEAPLDVTLPAAGFRAGLKELVRLRREEARASGKR